jgi:tetratricopeptide (TPR) repeat protein
MIRTALALALAILTSSAFAQSPPAPRNGERQVPAERDQVAPGPSPQDRGTLDSAAVRARLLDDLFGRLRAAPASEDAQGISEAIEAIWARTGSPTVDLMFVWFAEEVRARNMGRAADYLDGIILLAPDFAEAYYRRAQIAFTRRNYGQAMADLERVLALEPRHYGALTGVGTILRELERKREALAAFRAALEVHPHLAIAQRAVERLRVEVEGQEG